MTDINRRKFITICGGISIGLVGLTPKSKSMDLKINAFQNDVSTNLDNIETIKILIREIRLSSFNINDSKDATLSIYGEIDGKSVGRIKQMNISIEDNNEVVLNDIQADIKNNDSEFKSEYFDMDNYSDQENVTINTTFKINHPDIKEISDQKSFNIDFTDGEIDTYTYSEDNVSKKLIISSTKTQNPQLSDISIWDENRDEILESLIGSLNVNNMSSYSLPKGGIDSNIYPFNISPSNEKGEKQSSKGDEERFNIS